MIFSQHRELPCLLTPLATFFNKRQCNSLWYFEPLPHKNRDKLGRKFILDLFKYYAAPVDNVFNTSSYENSLNSDGLYFINQC